MMKIAFVLLLALTLAVAPVQADEHDHERARAALEAGQVLPLPVLMERLQHSYAGQVMALELKHDDGRWIYKVKLLQPGGQLSKLKVDAQTGEVLRIKTKGRKAGQPEAQTGAAPLPRQD
jgi:uncharacterized membrane protein YkoI